MATITELLKKLNPATLLVIGGVLGAFLSIGIDLYIKRPKLSVTGGGGGNHPNGFAVNHLSITNSVGWFGVRIPETRIFGLRIHPSLSLGIPFRRTSATNCRAQLFTTRTNEHIAQLWWKTPDGSVADDQTINSGESGSLILFASALGNDLKFFPYQPIDKRTGEVKLPAEPAYFSETTDFHIRIHHSYNQIFTHEVRIVKKFDGKLYLEDKTRSSFFRE